MRGEPPFLKGGTQLTNKRQGLSHDDDDLIYRVDAGADSPRVTGSGPSAGLGQAAEAGVKALDLDPSLRPTSMSCRELPLV